MFSVSKKRASRQGRFAPLAISFFVRGSGLITLGLLTGCLGKNLKVDNPVVGPPPPRLSLESPENDQLAQAEGDSSIQLLSYTSGAGIRDEDVAARVNGNPIFVSEILAPYRAPLEAERAKRSPEEYQRIRKNLIKRDLDGHIEQALVLDAVKKQIPAEQWDSVNEQLDTFFYDQELPRLQKEHGFQSIVDVEALMQQQGMTLATYRRIWGDRQLASQYVQEQLPKVKVTLPELRQAYRDRLEEFTEPEQIKWQQCWISTLKSGSKREAYQRLTQAVEALKKGKSFDQVIKDYSDGPRAKSAGHWDWVAPDSLSDEALRETLDSLEVDVIGPVLEDERGYRLIKLTGRRPARSKPFEEVQQELRESLIQEKRAAAAKKLIEKLKSEAHIETIFDHDQE